MPLRRIAIQYRAPHETAPRRKNLALPDDIPISTLTTILCKEMNAPASGPDGQPVHYAIGGPDGRYLPETATLDSAKIAPGALLWLIPQPQLETFPTIPLADRVPAPPDPAAPVVRRWRKVTDKSTIQICPGNLTPVRRWRKIHET
jgi:hypothetical protein